jgi:OmpA-like transmembrane domain
MKMRATMVFLLLAAAAPGALANDVGFYVGGYYGRVGKDVNRRSYDEFAFDINRFFNFTPTQSRTSFDDTDTTFALVMGYRLTRYLALEGAYTRLGQVTYQGRNTGNFLRDTGFLNVNIESETTGFEISALGTLPLSRNWEVFARAGALFAANELKVVISAHGEIFATQDGGEVADSFSKSTTEPFAALGVSRRFFEIYAIRLEYQRFFTAGLEPTGGQGDMDAALLGLTVTF